MRNVSSVLVLILLVAAMAVPSTAVAEHGDIHPTLRTEQVYFHCASANKLAGVDAALGDVASWDTTAPDTSFTAGAGCGYYDNVLSGGTGVFSATWTGTFTGNLDAIDVELHRLIAGAGGSVTAPQLVAILTIDGKEVYNGDINIDPFLASSTGASESAIFSFSKLGYLAEDGDGEKTRSITLTIDSYNEAQNAWVFDAEEVPAGLVFNPEDPVLPTYR